VGPFGSPASGDIAGAARQASFQAMTQFLNTVLDPFASRREVMSPSQLAGLDEGASAAKNQAYIPHWNIWAAGFGGSQTSAGSTTLAPGSVTSSVFGTVVGADHVLSQQTTVGFALAGGGTSFNSGFDAGRSDLFQAGAFARHMVKDVYVSAALAYGWQDVTALTGFDQPRNEADANAYSGRIETGYRFATPWLDIAPYAAGQFTNFYLPAYATQVHSGPFSAAASSTSVTDSRSELGFRTDKSFTLEQAALTLHGRLGWAHDFNPDRAISTLFQAPPGALGSMGQAPDSALAIASAELRWLNSLFASVTFQGEFSNTTQSYTGKAFVRYVW
jgi:uncharacterized protein with beta-barrel porin domain